MNIFVPADSEQKVDQGLLIFLPSHSKLQCTKWTCIVANQAQADGESQIETSPDNAQDDGESQIEMSLLASDETQAANQGSS